MGWGVGRGDKGRGYSTFKCKFFLFKQRRIPNHILPNKAPQQGDNISFISFLSYFFEWSIIQQRLHDRNLAGRSVLKPVMSILRNHNRTYLSVFMEFVKRSSQFPRYTVHAMKYRNLMSFFACGFCRQSSIHKEFKNLLKQNPANQDAKPYFRKSIKELSVVFKQLVLHFRVFFNVLTQQSVP